MSNKAIGTKNSDVIKLSRRENGLTIRFLAQVLFNDIIFKNQEGIKKLLSKLKKNGKDALLESGRLIIDFNDKFEHYFLFHLEDFNSNDKSELDIIVYNKTQLFIFEVKAFTNPNSPDVKRELVRNYLTMERIRKGVYFDNNIKEMYLILLYSDSFNKYFNKSANNFNYLNDDFLLKKNKKQRDSFNKKDEWMKGKYALKMQHLNEISNDEFSNKLKEISKKLFFLTWDDVYSSINELNEGERFSSLLNELKNKRDEKKQVSLIDSG